MYHDHYKLREARSDPSYIQYYYANVKQNPRLPPPLSRLYRGAGDGWQTSPRSFQEPDGTSDKGNSSKGSESSYHSLFVSTQTPKTPRDGSASASMQPFPGEIDWQMNSMPEKSTHQQQQQPQPIGSESPVRMHVRTSKSLVDVMGELSQSSSPKSAFGHPTDNLNDDLNDKLAAALSNMNLEGEKNSKKTTDPRDSPTEVDRRLTDTESQGHLLSPQHPSELSDSVSSATYDNKRQDHSMTMSGINEHRTSNDDTSLRRSSYQPEQVSNAPPSPYHTPNGEHLNSGSMYATLAMNQSVQQMNPVQAHPAMYSHGAPPFPNPQDPTQMIPMGIGQRPPQIAMDPSSQMQSMYGGGPPPPPAPMRPELSSSGQLPYGATDAYTAYCIRFAEAQLAAMAVASDPSVVAAAAMGHYPGGSAAAAAAAALAMSNTYRHNVTRSDYDARGALLNSYSDAILAGANNNSVYQNNYRKHQMGYSSTESRDGRHGFPKHNAQNERNRRSNVIGGDVPKDSLNSSLLEDFKNGKGKKLELRDVQGCVVEFSMDQHGSRFIQQKLETADSDEFEFIFNEVLPQCMTLMTDVFGNYVIQKLLEHGTDSFRQQLCQKMEGHVVNLSLQMYGCRVTQKAIEVLHGDHQLKLVRELDGHITRCVRDQNGNHVIQKCIEYVPSDDIAFILDSFIGNIAELAVHPYGCRVVQRIREHCKDEWRSRGVIEEIIESTSDLAKDQYGNYVVQHVLLNGSEEAKFAVVSKLQDKIVSMSQHKFASNVVEKILLHAAKEQKLAIIESIMVATEDPEFMLQMLRDQFANYVIQKLLDICSETQRDSLLDRIEVRVLEFFQLMHYIFVTISIAY